MVPHESDTIPINHHDQVRPKRILRLIWKNCSSDQDPLSLKSIITICVYTQYLYCKCLNKCDLSHEIS